MNSLKIKFSAGLLCLLVLTSCKLSLLPPYNKEISDQIEQVSKIIDVFYLSLLEKTDAGSRPYSESVDGYIKVETELNSLYSKNRIRPLNKESTRNFEIALKIWRGYKDDHKKKNSISDGIIKLNMKTMADLFYAIQVAEQGKE